MRGCGWMVSGAMVLIDPSARLYEKVEEDQVRWGAWSSRRSSVKTQRGVRQERVHRLCFGLIDLGLKVSYWPETAEE